MKYYPQEHAFMFGTIAYIVMLIIFIYFLVTTFRNQVLQEFISLDKGAGECKEVMQLLNMHVQASTLSGSWETDPGFIYSEATLDFKFNRLTTTEVEFKAMMDAFADQLGVLGAQSAQSPFMSNLLHWMHFGTVMELDGALQEMVFTATPNDVYNHRHMFTTVASVDGLCRAPSTSWFDVSSASLVIEWDVATYNNASCGNISDLESLGWEERDGELAVIKVDTISTSTAMAANLGILPADDLNVVGFQLPVYRDLVVTKRFDPAFPRMRPLYCFQRLGTGENITAHADKSHFSHDSDADAERAYNLFTAGASPICFVDFGGQVAIPAVHHYLPGCRDCDGNTSFPEYGIDNYCDYFDVMIGVIFYPGVGLWTEVVELFFKYPDFKSLSDRTFYPLYDMAEGDENSTSYEFCDGCKLLGVNIWDEDTYMSPNFLSVSPTHCVDTFSLTEENRERLGLNPPTRLVEPYYRCRMFPNGAFMSSIGIAAGNLGAFGPLAILILVMPLVYIYFALNDAEPPSQKYDLVKIMKAQREFIEKVLGANDGTLEGVQKDGVIQQLGVELYNLAQYEEGKSIVGPGAAYKQVQVVPAKDVNV